MGLHPPGGPSGGSSPDAYLGCKGVHPRVAEGTAGARVRWLRRSWQEAFLAHRPPAHPRAVSPSQTTLPLPAQPSGGGRPRRPHSSPSLCQGGWLLRVPGARISDCKAPQRTVRVWGSGLGGGMLGRVHGVAVGSPQMSLGEHSCPGQPGLGLQE